MKTKLFLTAITLLTASQVFAATEVTCYSKTGVKIYGPVIANMVITQSTALLYVYLTNPNGDISSPDAVITEATCIQIKKP